MDFAYTLDQLCQLADCSKRTVRYYVQLGLLPRPQGQTRAARYGTTHLDQLLRIKSMSANGWSLERIAQALRGTATAPPTPRQPGSVQVRRHVWLAPGVELQIDAAETDLPPEQLHGLVQAVVDHWSQRHEPSAN